MSQKSPKKESVGSVLLKVVCLTLAYIPVFRIALIINRYGENNPSSDDVRYFGLIDKVLHGEYAWGGFLRDAFQANGHLNVFPILFQTLIAKVSGFNYFFALNLVLFLFVLKLLLLFLIFRYRIRGLLNYVLLVPVSFLVFSYTQISVFEHDMGDLQMSLNHLGFLFGLWALLRFPGMWRGVVLASLGGFLASWSWGGGTMAWPIFAFGMLCLGCRRPWQYLFLVAVGCLACSPYFYFLFTAGQTHLASGGSNPFLHLGFDFFLKGIGLPLAKGGDWEQMGRIGACGLAAFALALPFLFRRGWAGLIEIAPMLMVMCYGVFHIGMVALFRATLTPWYASPHMFFWIGLLGLAALLVQGWYEKQGKRGLVGILQAALAAAIFLLIGYFYWVSNRTWEDKSAFLKTRSPVSASCLRHYRTAPTYCENELFVWGSGNFSLLDFMGRPMERSGLSVFGKRQWWSLQGDYILDEVTVSQKPGIPKVIWLGEHGAPYPYNDFRRLDLFLHSPNSVEWRVRFPKNLKTATLESAVQISPNAPKANAADGVTAKVLLVGEDGQPRLLFNRRIQAQDRAWHSFTLPLSSYAGQSVKLVFQSDPMENPIHDWLVFEGPAIQVETEGPTEPLGSEPTAPENTELNPAFQGLGSQGLPLNIASPSSWSHDGVDWKEKDGAVEMEILQAKHAVTFQQGVDVAVRDYGRLYFKMSVDPKITPRAARLKLQFFNRAKFEKEVFVPLLADGGEHEYVFDLKNFELDEGDRLVGITFSPIAAEGSAFPGCKLRLSSLQILSKSSS